MPIERCGGLVLAVVLGGCAQLPVQEACTGERTLYVVNHGWHSGIVVERADLVRRLPALGAEIGHQGYVEIGWGEERFYQARETTVSMALRAVLQSNASVVQVVPLAGPPQRYFTDITETRTDEAGYTATLDFIAATFKPQLERLGPSLYGEGWFYRAEGSFHLFNNCNSWVAAAVEKARCHPP